MDSGSHAYGGLPSESFSLFSTAHYEFVQDLNTPQGPAAHQLVSSLRQQQSASSSGIDCSLRNGEACAPSAATSRASCSDASFALSSSSSISSRRFTPFSYLLVTADRESTATQSDPVAAAGFTPQPCAYGQVQGTSNTVLLVDSRTGAILDTADSKLGAQSQHSIVDDVVQAMAVQHAVPLHQHPAPSQADEETLLAVAAATGLITADASGSMIQTSSSSSSSSSNSQALQQPIEPAGAATTNKMDTHHLSPAQQQSAVIAMLAALLQPAASGAFKASTGPTEQHAKYKTELCRGWLESGMCRYGSKCQFAHGSKELRPMPTHPQVCHSYLATGRCAHGSSCRFVHGMIASNLLASMGAGSGNQQQPCAPMQHSFPNMLGTVVVAAGSSSPTQMGLEGVSGWDDQPVVPRSNWSGGSDQPLPSLPAQAAAARSLLTSPGVAAAPPPPHKQPNLFALRANSASIQKAAASAWLSVDSLAAARANLAWKADNCVVDHSHGRSLDGGSSAYSYALSSRILYGTPSSANSTCIDASRISFGSSFESSTTLNSIIAGSRTSLESTALPGACSM